MEEVRRVVARLGSSTRAHAVPPIVVAVSAPPTLPATAALRVAPLSTHATRWLPDGVQSAPRVASARVAAPDVSQTAPIAMPAARSVAPLPRPRRRRAALIFARLHTARRGEGPRTIRRRRVAWSHLSRERLGAAWTRVQRDHGDGGELRLLGVVGPVPLGAIESVVLEPDGRVALTLARRARPGRTGDVALARRLGTGRLVRCDIPYPASGGFGRDLR